MNIQILFPVEKARIPEEVRKIRERIQGIDAEKEVLLTMLRTIQKGCDHNGQVTGYNERDSSWGNPCPTCGYYY